MTNKQLRERMSTLDDIGFIGTQEYLTPGEWAELHRKTGEAIRKYQGKQKRKTRKKAVTRQATKL